MATGAQAAADGEAFAGFLQRVFACSAEVAAQIGRRAAERAWPARAVMLRQGDGAEHAYLMVAGRAQALLYGLDGQLVLLHEFAPGDLFGAVAELGGDPQDADIVAVEPSRAALFAALEFLGLIEAHACVGLAVSRMLLKQLRASTTRMVEGVTLSAPGRVHAELLRLAKAGRDQGSDGRTISPPPVLAALAVRVHSTRETVSRTINALERRGLIRREPEALVLVAPHRLEEMMV